MKWLIILFLCLDLSVFSQSFTEFYCDNSIASSNVFSGSTTSATPTYSSFAGNWDGTSVYTPTDNSTPANTVSVGMWASVYADGAVVAVYVARVLTVAAGVNGAITLSTTAIAGTSPSSSANARTIRVGGCWHGPGTRDILGGQGGSTNYFPFDFAVGTMTNIITSPTRVNFKSGTTYSVTNGITHSKAGPVILSGYTTTVNDGGRAIIDGGVNGIYYVLLTLSANDTTLQDFVFAHNGNSSANQNGVNLTGARNIVQRCVFHDFRLAGCSIQGANTMMIEDEAYSCNLANTAATGAFDSSAAGIPFFRCIAHNNAGNNCLGFRVSGSAYFIHCIADSNGASGIAGSTGNGAAMLGVFNCDFRNNTSSGLLLNPTSDQNVYIENCNFIVNGSGISSASALRLGSVVNCGFGSGTMTNANGDIVGTSVAGAASGIYTNANITYSANVTPWVDPANGDFRINLPASKAAGRGAFTETQAGYSGTIGYPDIGAAQSPSTNGGFGATFAQ